MVSLRSVGVMSCAKMMGAIYGSLGLIFLPFLLIGGFASMVFGINRPIALSFQYIALLATTGLGLTAIGRGTIIEPPAILTNAIAAITERLSRRFAAT